MSSTTPLLSNELAAIVHHVELNRAGWWDKAVQRLVLASVWLHNKPSSTIEILSTIESEFRLTLSETKIKSIIEILERQNALVRLPGPTFRISDEKCTVFEREIADVETVAKNARAYFSDLVEELCEGLDQDETWKVFESKLLTPLIREVGANAYRLIVGEKMTADERLVRRFLDHFESHLEISLRQLVTSFLDPNKEEVRKYVSSMLHAVFCVAASGLSENVIEKLSASTGKQIEFRVFVDTNFLFSILALHDNPSNAAATELNNLIATLQTNPKVKVDLFITPRTIDEAKQSIFLAKTQLTELPSGSNFTGAALHAGFSGMVIKFLEERSQRNKGLSVEDWFAPYLNDFVLIARSKGVELFNDTLDSYATCQDVINDILLVMERGENSQARPKSYETVEHDMILWHFVKNSRPAYVESPIDAKDWILTLDYRLIHFDESKRKQPGASVPICVHPTSLIQLLQFWVPRTKEFEEAILGSMRLPFLFREFDAEAERTSLRILKGIGRFEGSENFSEETIRQVMLNEALRASMGTEEGEKTETELIHDTLLEEMNAQKETEANRAQHLEGTLKTRDVTLSALESKTKDKEKEIEELKNTIAREEQKFSDAAKTIQVHEQKIQSMEEKQRKQEEAKELRLALIKYLTLLFVVLLVSFSAAWWLADQMQTPTHIVGITATRILVGIMIFVLCHLGLEWWVRRRAPMNRLWPFRQICKFRAGLWYLVILGFVGGVVGNLVANGIQQKIDKQELSIMHAPSETDIE